jgi:hypothetical protein
MVPYAGVDYTTSPYVDSRVDFQHMNNGQPYARVGLNPVPESNLSSWKGLRIWHSEFSPPSSKATREPLLPPAMIEPGLLTMTALGSEYSTKELAIKIIKF